MMIVEVCADSVASAKVAQEAGAHRIELCDSLIEGGITPSYGKIKLIRQTLTTTLLFVIIRPRGGDFLYSDEEFEIMKYDIQECKSMGVDGVVIGILNEDGTVDQQRVSIVVELAKPMFVTFHRAFDMTNDAMQALETISKISGIQRILTSGHAKTVMEGIEEVKQLLKKAEEIESKNGNQLIIVPGGGVNVNNAAQIISYSNATEIHLSGRKKKDGKMKYRNRNCTMGPPLTSADQNNDSSDYSLNIADLSIIQTMVSLPS